MTAASYFESVHGVHCDFLSKPAIIELMEKFSDHKHEEWRARKVEWNNEQFTANEENKRATYGKDKKNE